MSATGSLPSRHIPATALIPRATGFTLLELLIALSLAALVVGMSVPAMQNLYQSAQYRGAVSDVMTSLNSTRHAAIRDGQQRDLLINPETREITRASQVTKIPDSIDITVLGARELNRDGAGVIRFYPTGGSSGGYVSLSHDNGMRARVDVDWLLGRVSLCKEDCTEAGG